VKTLELDEDRRTIFSELEELLGGGFWTTCEAPQIGIIFKTKYKNLEGKKRPVPVGQAEAVADCTAEEAAAWYFEHQSVKRSKRGLRNGNVARLELHRKGIRTNEKVFAVVKKTPFFYYNREFVFKHIMCFKEDGTVSVAVYPEEGFIDYGGSIGSVIRGQVRALFTAKNIDAVGNVPQCKVQLSFHTDLRGFATALAPEMSFDRNISRPLEDFVHLLDSFNRDKEHDHATLLSLAKKIKQEHQHYSLKEEEYAKIAKELFTMCTNGSHKHRLKSPDKAVKMSIIFSEADKNIPLALGTTVVDLGIEDCAGYGEFFYLRLSCRAPY
jgi:hypothetical protein